MSNKRTIFLLILLLVVVVVGYPLIKNNVGSIEEEVKEAIVSADMNRVLADIMSAKLDIGVLNSQVLLQLEDFTLPLPGLPIGRTNPFAPLK
ncbi:MAG: hypothetical protein AAB861_01345 [Patescibacteria group bacterium]